MSCLQDRISQLYDSKTGSVQVGDITVDQSFWRYNSYVGNNHDINGQSSGAYIFRPDGDPININKKPKHKSYSGSLLYYC